MKISDTDNMYQKKVHITYDSMEELIAREQPMTNTLNSYLARFNNEQYISDTSISITDNDKYLLTFTLDLTK